MCVCSAEECQRPTAHQSAREGGTDWRGAEVKDGSSGWRGGEGALGEGQTAVKYKTHTHTQSNQSAQLVLHSYSPEDHFLFTDPLLSESTHTHTHTFRAIFGVRTGRKPECMGMWVATPTVPRAPLRLAPHNGSAWIPMNGRSQHGVRILKWDQCTKRCVLLQTGTYQKTPTVLNTPQPPIIWPPQPWWLKNETDLWPEVVLSLRERRWQLTNQACRAKRA